MAKTQESLEPAVNEMESVIQEQIEAVRQALEKHSSKLREKAEQDSSEIIILAKEEANKIVAQAREEATIESARIIARSKEEAEQVARESRKEAAKARQESAKVISDTREKASQIIAEIIERGSKQAQSESARAVSEARNRTSELLTQVSKSFEEIISQAERRVKSELKGLATLMAEAQTRLQPLIETSDNKAEESSQQATGEVVTATDSGDQKAESALLSTADKGTAAVKASNDTRLFKGRLKLEMIPPFDQEELECVPEWLPRLPSLRVMSTGGYAQANRWITTYTVDLEKPLPLFKILKAVPAVKEVTEDKGNIVVTMR